MRLFTATIALMSISVSAGAQERGSLTLDAMTTPGRHFGVGYYFTDGLSLRPSLGASYSAQYGMVFNLGTDLRWELLPRTRFSPYLTASFNYLRDPSLVQYDSTGSPLVAPQSNVARYGAGLGLRARLRDRLSLVGEGRVMNSALRDVSAAGSYGQQGLQNGAHFEAALGLSYALH